MATYLNLCTSCNTDFSSVTAFDAHRVGVHAYTHSEGLKMDPMREDGRRCLTHDEMLAAPIEGVTKQRFEQDSRGRWRIAMTDAKREGLQRHLARVRSTP